MEKFAVDLDKVLDDFEYFEDHSADVNAIQVASYSSSHSKQINAPPIFNPRGAPAQLPIQIQVAPTPKNSQYYHRDEVITNFTHTRREPLDEVTEPRQSNHSNHAKNNRVVNETNEAGVGVLIPINYQQATNFQPTNDVRMNLPTSYERFEEFNTNSCLSSVNTTISQNFNAKNHTGEELQDNASQPFSTESLKNRLFTTPEKNTTNLNNVSTNIVRNIPAKKNSVSNVFNSLQEYINSDLRSADQIVEAASYPLLPKITNWVAESATETSLNPSSSNLNQKESNSRSEIIPEITHFKPEQDFNTVEQTIINNPIHALPSGILEVEPIILSSDDSQPVHENVNNHSEILNHDLVDLDQSPPGIVNFNPPQLEASSDGEESNLMNLEVKDNYLLENATNLTDLEKSNIESIINEQNKLMRDSSNTLHHEQTVELKDETVLNNNGNEEEIESRIVGFDINSEISESELENYLNYLEELESQTDVKDNIEETDVMVSEENINSNAERNDNSGDITDNQTTENIPKQGIIEISEVEGSNKLIEETAETEEECDPTTRYDIGHQEEFVEYSEVVHTESILENNIYETNNTNNNDTMVDDDEVIIQNETNSDVIVDENTQQLKRNDGSDTEEECTVVNGDHINYEEQPKNGIEVVEVRKRPPLCRPNSLDLASKITVEENTTAIAPPGETPMNKNGGNLDEMEGNAANMNTEGITAPNDFSPSTSEVSSIENNEGCVLDDQANPQSSAFDNHSTLGRRPPYWIPDTDTNFCMHCGFKFNVIKRRHHCRACGMVLCSKCCNMKAKLQYLGNIESRVCAQCYEILLFKDAYNAGADKQENTSSDSATSSPAHTAERGGQPNPNNPMEYCSTVPPLQQIENQRPSSPPTVMVPVGVLKRQGSNKARTEKTVMFSDGIRPGCDLTELDNSWESKPIRRQNKRVSTPPGAPTTKVNRNLPTVDSKTMSYIPTEENCLPPTINFLKPESTFTECSNNESVVEMLKNEALVFAIQRNFNVHLKIVNLECCVNKQAWCFSTRGLSSVGQDEIVILLECLENENRVPKDVFLHLNNIFTDASKGNTITEMGFSIENAVNFLGSKNHAGFLYVRPTYQCLQNVILPNAPYLVGILIHRWETPWVKIFPLRLLLRLGAEYRYYPCPIISTRNRESVFVEIGHTIINLLADFRNYSYTLPSVRGLIIHMEERKTTVSIPKNRYDQVMRALSNSSDHILAFAGNFSSVADSHLVCIQNTSGSTENGYSTHAINIQNKPRKVTGASFIILNGALKTTSGLTAKSSIIEDGLMIQILPDQMVKLRDSLKNMKPFQICCGCINTESDEYVNIAWTDNDVNFNIGVKSPIDNRPMDGVPSIRVHNGTDHIGSSKLIRWTEVFIMQSGEENSKAQDPVDISKLSESISKSTCQALVKYLDLLVTNHFTKVAIRATLHSENVSYEAGSNGVKLAPIYMNSLDNELIPVLHNIISNHLGESPVVLELIFHILNL